MVASVIKWEGASVDRGGIDTGATLADNTMSAASAEIDNSSNLDTLYWLELTTSDDTALFSVAPDDAQPTVDIYMTQAPDGSKYESVPVTGGAQQGNKFVDSFPVEKNTTQVTVVIGPIALPPQKLKI